MKLGDLTELAARNLRESVLRNSLTTLGISVGIASLVALLSLGVGLQQLVNRSVARAGRDPSAAAASALAAERVIYPHPVPRWQARASPSTLPASLSV